MILQSQYKIALLDAEGKRVMWKVTEFSVKSRHFSLDQNKMRGGDMESVSNNYW
jgi:hypothetical protein